MVLLMMTMMKMWSRGRSGRRAAQHSRSWWTVDGGWLASSNKSEDFQIRQEEEESKRKKNRKEKKEKKILIFIFSSNVCDLVQTSHDDLYIVSRRSCSDGWRDTEDGKRQDGRSLSRLTRPWADGRCIWISIPVGFQSACFISVDQILPMWDGISKQVFLIRVLFWQVWSWASGGEGEEGGGRSMVLILHVCFGSLKMVLLGLYSAYFL